jgi:hypothetical protein
VRSDEGGPRQYDGAGDEEPSTHIPIYPDAGERGGGGRRGNRFIRGAPLQYNSTYSFGPGGGSSTHAAHRTAPPLPPTPTTATQPTRSTSTSPVPPFVQETVNSTIPLALFKAQFPPTTAAAAATTIMTVDEEAEFDLSIQKAKEKEDKKDPIPTKIYWNGGGKRVVMARAGDNSWKGRLDMEPECVCLLSLPQFNLI